MPDLLQRPDGQWFDPSEPKACRTCGGEFVPRGYVHGWDSTRAYWFCLRDDPSHVDTASRFTYTCGPQTPGPANLGTPDHGLMRP
jgi:hypothetical protein